MGANAALPGRRVRLCVVATVAITVRNMFRGRLEYLVQRGFDITVVCAPSPLGPEIEARGLRLHTAPLTRSVAPLRDLRALLNLWRFLRRERFDLVEVSTPKAALVGAIAARLAGVPRLVHLVHGLAYQNQRGVLGWVLRQSTRLPCRLADSNIGVSYSLREQADRDGVCPRERMTLLDRGSCNGVDLERFRPELRRDGPAVRDAWGIPRGACVLGYVGRMTGDKGLRELIDAFEPLSEAYPDVHLLMVGDYESRDRPAQAVIDRIASHPRIKHLGWLSDPLRAYLAIDVLVLPSYREGLATVLLEAAALGLPVVTTDAVGCRDAIDDGVTGLCVPVGDAQRLREALEKLIRDPSLRERMGQAGRRWVEQHFDQHKIWRLYETTYRGLIAAKPAP
jgi:glycosyltransferase involved in cell wall biosynthesis